MNKEKLVLMLFENGIIQFGSFKLKSGIISPFYIDLRKTITYPKLLKIIIKMFLKKTKKMFFDAVTGVPYAALPFATLIADKLNKPLILFRKEEKHYGTGGILVGKALPDARCLVIDDLITTGLSKIEIAKQVEQEGMKIASFLVLIDRSKNAKEELNYDINYIITAREIFTILFNKGKITNEQKNMALEHVYD